MVPQVYTMQGDQGGPAVRTILQNINLSFFPGAKIGVLGLQRFGKIQRHASWQARTPRLMR